MDSLAFDSTTTPNILLSVLTVKKLRPITVGAIRAMNQSEFLAISRILFKAREKSRVQGVIDFGLKTGARFFQSLSEALAIALLLSTFV